MDVTLTVYTLATTVHKRGRREEALALYKKAYTETREDHPDAKIFLDGLRKIQEEIQREGECGSHELLVEEHEDA